MRNYKNLSTLEQQQVKDKLFLEELNFIVETGAEFYPEIRKEIDDAWNKANTMKTPWFYSEYLMEYPAIKEAIKLRVSDLVQELNIIIPDCEDYIVKLN